MPWPVPLRSQSLNTKTVYPEPAFPLYLTLADGAYISPLKLLAGPEKSIELLLLGP